MNDEKISELIKIARKYDLSKLILFGSAVESIDKANDIDFACSGITGKKFLRLGIELEELFNKSVDLFLIDNSRFSSEILKNGFLIYESKTN